VFQFASIAAALTEVSDCNRCSCRRQNHWSVRKWLK